MAGSSSSRSHFDLAWQSPLPGQGVRGIDLAALTVVPLVLVAVFLLPMSVRRSLAFDYAEPTLLTAAVAPYVHLEWSHLLVNVIGYLIVAPTAYLLSVASSHRTRFFAAFATFLLVFPPVLSYLNLAAVRSASGLGFSGIVLAFVGYLAFAIAEHMQVNLRIGPAWSTGGSLFFLGFAIAAPLSVRSVTVDRATVALGIGGLVLATLLSALLFALVAAETESLGRRLRLATANRGSFELGVVGTVVFLLFQFVAFPADPTGNGSTLNLYTHLLGYALGFMVTFVTVHVVSRFEAERQLI